MKKCWVFTACFLLLALLGTGCGEAADNENAVPTTSITLSKDGTITYRLSEEFGKSYYNISELEQMAREEVDDFNQKNPRENGTAVSVQKVETVNADGEDAVQVIADVDIDRTVIITYLFHDDNAFSKFTEEEIYFGSVADAIENNSVTFLGRLGAVSGSNSITELELNQYKKHMVYSTDSKTPVYSDMKPMFASDGVVFSSDGMIDFSNVEGTAVVIFK